MKGASCGMMARGRGGHRSVGAGDEVLRRRARSRHGALARHRRSGALQGLVSGVWNAFQGTGFTLVKRRLTASKCRGTKGRCRVPKAACRANLGRCRVPKRRCRASFGACRVAGRRCRASFAACRVPGRRCRVARGGCRASFDRCRVRARSCRASLGRCRARACPCRGGKGRAGRFPFPSCAAGRAPGSFFPPARHLKGTRRCPIIGK